jgi:putative DNA primase/helicase
VSSASEEVNGGSEALSLARAYVAAGVSVIPIARDGTKAPDGRMLPRVERDGKLVASWVPFQDRLPTEEELARWFGGRRPAGLATVGGAVSGALEHLDFDRNAGEVFPAWCDLVEAECPGLVERLSVAETPSGGYHVRYRCPDMDIPGNRVLAKDPAVKGKGVIIETRGEGGYCVAPGSPADCHESGRPYVHRSGPVIPPALSLDEYDFVLTVARSFDRRTEAPPRQSGLDLRPGDDFDRRGPDWADILGPHGWACAFGSPGGERRWRRAGKSRGWSATTGHCRGEDGAELLYVFSSNAAPFEDGKAYGKFRAYAVLNHGGDLSAAADELARQGYGSRPRKSAAGASGGGPSRPDASAEGDATVADLIRAGATTRWAWKGWLPVGELVILASDPGVGKTRMCADLARRVYHALPWPDGSAAYFPPRSKTLWVCADCQYPELTTLARDFAIDPECMILNASKANPFAGTMLDSEEDLKDFEARIARVRPAIIYVDTTLKATDRTAHKPEDAKAFFTPLQQIAQRQQALLVCVTHLNANGKPLGRRVEGAGRVVIMMECPDPEGQPNRRKLHIKKSHSLYPAALGVTMGDKGNDYDTSPPQAPTQEPGASQAKARAADKVAEWLRERLKDGPEQVWKLRDEAENQGFSSKTLYAARAKLELEEFESEKKKWWALTPSR